VAVNELVKDDFPDSGKRVWEQGWEDHSRRQMERLAALSLPEKLVWLEEAHRLVLHMQSKQTGARKRK